MNHSFKAGDRVEAKADGNPQGFVTQVFGDQITVRFGTDDPVLSVFPATNLLPVNGPTAKDLNS